VGAAGGGDSFKGFDNLLLQQPLILGTHSAIWEEGQRPACWRCHCCCRRCRSWRRRASCHIFRSCMLPCHRQTPPMDRPALWQAWKRRVETPALAFENMPVAWSAWPRGCCL